LIRRINEGQAIYVTIMGGVNDASYWNLEGGQKKRSRMLLGEALKIGRRCNGVIVGVDISGPSLVLGITVEESVRFPNGSTRGRWARARKIGNLCVREVKPLQGGILTADVYCLGGRAPSQGEEIACSTFEVWVQDIEWSEADC
jgi:hypothetical protein